METKKIRQCLYCGAKDLVFFIKRKDGINLVKCEKCGLIFTEILPFHEITSIYSKGYFDKNNIEKIPDIGYVAYSSSNYLDFLWQKDIFYLFYGSHFDSKIKLLDVGCAHGYFLQLLSYDKRIEAKGIDIANEAVRKARERNLNVEVKDILEETAKYDVITAWDLIEHIPDIGKFFSKVFDLLKEDGIFIFSTPDVGARIVKEKGEEWIGFKSSLEHVLYFDKYSLSSIINDIFNNIPIFFTKIEGEFATLIGFIRKGKYSKRDIIIKNLLDSNFLDQEGLSYEDKIHILSFLYRTEGKETYMYEMVNLIKNIKDLSNYLIPNLIITLDYWSHIYRHKKDEQITILKDKLKKSKAALELYKQLTKEKINYLLSEIEKYKHEIEKYKHEIEHDKQAEIDYLYSQLNAIYESDFWKVASFYYKIRDSIPFLKYSHRILRILRREGLSSLISKSNRWPYKVLKNIKESGIKEILKKIKSQTRSHKVILRREIQDHKIRSESDNSWAPGIKGLVSVILPVYNQVDMLEKAVESVLKQTYKNFELILINDGSTDGVEKVLKKYVNHPRIIVLTQKNLKLPAALNNAFRYASGEYYTWTSADNILLPRQLEVLVNELERHPEWGMVYSDYQAIDNNGNPLNDSSFRPHNQDLSDPSIMRLPDEVTYDNFHSSGDNFIGPSFMYRRSVAWAIGEYAVDTFGGEDYDYWLRIYHLFKIGHCPEILYLYRVHENTLNTKAKELGLFENINRLLARDRKRIDFLKQDIPIIIYQSGIVLPETPAIVIFDKDTISKVRFPKHILAILILQTDETLPNKDVLDKADIIVVQNKKMFYCFEKDYPYKIFFLENGKIEEPFLKVAKIRLFDKLNISQQKLPTPSVFIIERIKLALQVDSLDKGGLEQVVYDLACHLDKEKFKTFIFINNKEIGYIGTLLKEKGYPVIMIHGDKRKLETEIAKNGIHIVNFHYSIFGIDIYRDCGIRSIYTIHNNYTWFDPTTRQIRNEAFKQIDFFIAVSEQVKQFFLNKFEVDCQKVTAIPNGLNPKNFAIIKEIERSEIGLKKDDFVFLNVASFNPTKFQNILISAMKILVKQYPNFKLICIGNILDKKYYNYVKQRVLREGLKDNVIFKDFVSKEELGGYYKMADVFVLPSIQEGWSNVIMEAMYFGLPLIISNIGSAQDIMKCGKFGYIIPNPYERIEDITVNDILTIAYNDNPPNLFALIKAMEESYKTREWWQRQSNALNKAIMENFTVDIMCQKYEQVFLEQLFIKAKKKNRYTQNEFSLSSIMFRNNRAYTY